MGPSLFTMPSLIEDIFVIAKKPISKYFSYKKKSVVCNYFYEDGTKFTVHSNKNTFIKTAVDTFDVTEKEMRFYLKRCEEKFNLLSELFLQKSLHKVSTYLSKDTLKAIFNLHKLNINTNLSDYNSSYFRDKKLVQFYNRFATYNGSSPYKTPGVMSLIPHLEHSVGTFFPKGGMSQIVKSLTKLAKDVGVKFICNSMVDKIIIQNNQVKGINVNNHFIPSDIVVSNVDVALTYKKLLTGYEPPFRILNQERSSSAIIFYWGIKKIFPELDLHNIFFSEDYKNEFKCIFDEQTISDDPTIYINISSKEQVTDAPIGCENWFTMINVPSNSGQDWNNLIRIARKNIILKLNRILKTEISELINYEYIMDPVGIEKSTNSFLGSIYGSSSNSKFSAFLRHPNFRSSISNLYFCGGSVHPGGGIPLCIWSSKIVSELIE